MKVFLRRCNKLFKLLEIYPIGKKLKPKKILKGQKRNAVGSIKIKTSRGWLLWMHLMADATQ